MATRNQAGDTLQDVAPQDQQLAQQQMRARRLAALKAAEGIWKDRADIPKDGVEFQKLLRAEWD